MSELSELRRQIAEIHKCAIETGNDVRWIKDGMERGTKRMDGHERRIGSLENTGQRSSGFVAGVSAVFGAALGAVGVKFGWPTHP